MESQNVFQIVDYCVLIAMMLFSLCIGVYYAFSGGRQKSTTEYFVGNKSMGLIPITLSLLASFFSSNTLLGIPAEVYAFGFNWWFSLIGALTAMPFVGYLIMPVFYNLGATSTYEYLQIRFDRKVRLTASFFFILYLSVYAAFVTYGPSLALSQVTGLNFWISVATLCIVGTVYTAIGGIKAVMWTDSLQMIVMIVSLIIILIKGFLEIGSVQILYERNVEGLRISPLSFDLDPTVRFSFWNLSLFALLLWGGVYGMAQYQVQRYLSAPTLSLARRSIWLNLPGQFLVQSLVCLIGLLMYAKYWNCDPLKTKKVEALDQLFPAYVMDTLSDYPGLPGLFVAGIFSGSLSTTSSVLNCLAVIILDDYIKPSKRWSQISDEKATLIAKFIAVFFGFFTIIMVAVVSVIGSEIQQASGTVLGCLSGTVYGIFFAAMFFPWINSVGALAGMFTGFTFSAWIGLGMSFTKANSFQKLPVSDACLSSPNDTFLSPANATLMSFPMTNELSDIPTIYRISYLWNYVFCVFLVAAVGSIFSLFNRDYTYDRRLYSPVVNYIHDKILKRSQDHKTMATYSTCPTKEELIKNDVQI